VQKRDFLRRHGRAGRPTFVIDRAHLGLYLLGLPELLHSLFGGDVWTNDVALQFTQQLARQVHETLSQEAQTVHLHGLLDDPPREPPGHLASPETLALDWRTRLRIAGRLHTAFGRGTLWLPLTEASPLEPEELIDLLYFAWRQTSVSRIRLARPAERHTQLTVW
jgi:hypothetical protein